MSDPKPCPWCRPRMDTSGVLGHVYAATPMEWVPCGWCRGTGRFEVWAEHPEYHRLQAEAARHARFARVHRGAV